MYCTTTLLFVVRGGGGGAQNKKLHNFFSLTTRGGGGEEPVNNMSDVILPGHILHVQYTPPRNDSGLHHQSTHLDVRMCSSCTSPHWEIFCHFVVIC